MIKRLIGINPLIYIGIILLIGLFYWFQVRPELKRKSCFNAAFKSYHEMWDIRDEDKDGKLKKDTAELLYKRMENNIDRCIKIWK